MAASPTRSDQHVAGVLEYVTLRWRQRTADSFSVTGKTYIGVSSRRLAQPSTYGQDKYSLG